MSHTFYDSPESNRKNPISIDVTAETVWFFQHGEDGGEGSLPCVTVPKSELPAIYKAMGEYLETEVDE